MEYHTLVFTPWMTPHRVVPWQKAIKKYVAGSIQVLEPYDGVVIPTERRDFPIPSVARIVRNIPTYKRGVKFSRLNILTRDNFTCAYCGVRFPRKKLNYDHVIPRRLGGKTVWENIVSSCYPCNDRKGGRTPEQAGMRLLNKPHRPSKLPLVMPAISLEDVPESWPWWLQGHGLMMEMAG